LRFRYLLVVTALLAGTLQLPADVLDPAIEISPGGDSNPISTGINNVQPDFQNGNLVFAFYNDTTAVITGFDFQTTVNTGLTNIGNSFSCDTGGFFLNCDATYNSSTGLLDFNFSGVNPDDGDPGGDEVGEQEGIPTLLPQCTGTPDGPGCTDVGHFNITLQGWLLNAQSGDGQNIFPPNGVTLTNDFTVAPEPESIVLLGSVMLLAAWMIRRRHARSS
jgi:hypothetical protein